MRDYPTDDAWQMAMREKVLVPLYGRLFESTRYATDLYTQKTLGIDTYATRRSGQVIGIEEKIVRWPGYNYDALSLETGDDRGDPSWLQTSIAHWLVWVYMLLEDEADIHIFDLQALKQWFWPLEDSFPTYGPLTYGLHTYGRRVKIETIEAAGIAHRFFFHETESGKYRRENPWHYCHCGEFGSRGSGAKMRAGINGVWYCAAHLPGAAGNGASTQGGEGSPQSAPPP